MHEMAVGMGLGVLCGVSFVQLALTAKILKVLKEIRDRK